MKKPAMPNVSDFIKNRTAREDETLLPDFPDDLISYDDGTWKCSEASFIKLDRSFTRYGLALAPFGLYEKFRIDYSFILSMSSLMRYLGQGWVESEQSPETVTYLKAVSKGNLPEVEEALKRLRASGLSSTGNSAPPLKSHLTLVR